MLLPLLAFSLAKYTHAPPCQGLFELGILRDTPASELLYTMGDPANTTDALWATRTLSVMGLMAAGEIHLGFIGGAEKEPHRKLNTPLIPDPQHSPNTTPPPRRGGGAEIFP